MQEPLEEATATPAVITSPDQSIESEGVAERVKAPSRRMALIGVLLGVVAIGAVGIWAVFRPPTSIQPPVGDIHTSVRGSVGEVPLSAGLERALKPKDVFKECATCPEMVVVPAGSFTMGSPANEIGRNDNESPQHAVTFARQLAVGRFALTFDEWDACAADGGCDGYKPSDQGWGQTAGALSFRVHASRNSENSKANRIKIMKGSASSLRILSRSPICAASSPSIWSLQQR